MVFSRVRFNSFVLIFSFFQYGLCTISSIWMDRRYFIMISSFILYSLIIVLNINKLYKEFWLLLISVFILIGTQYILYPDQLVEINNIFLNFSTLGSTALFIGACKIDFSLVYNYAMRLAVLNYLLLQVYFIFSYSNMDSSSMLFGYALLPSAIFFMYKCVRDRKYIYGFLFLLSLVQLFIWGSRGTILILISFSVLRFIYNSKKNKYYFAFFLLLLLFLKDNLIAGCLQLISFLPIDSHKLRNYQSMLTSGAWENSSGRNQIYEQVFDVFVHNMNGLGVGYWGFNENDGSIDYPHNFFLQIGVEYGMIGLFFSFFFLFYTFSVINRMNMALRRDILLIFFSISFIRLMVSSSYWLRPEFWIFISLIYSCNVKLISEK